MPGLPQATYISLAVHSMIKNFLNSIFFAIIIDFYSRIVQSLFYLTRWFVGISPHQTYLCVFVLPANRELRIATDKPHCVWCNPRSIFYQMIHGLDASTLEDICRQYAPALCPFLYGNPPMLGTARNSNICNHKNVHKRQNCQQAVSDVRNRDNSNRVISMRHLSVSFLIHSVISAKAFANSSSLSV
nr:MAG TPA: hypothetical protein [Caudoviricetes sp.]